jgi:hypothetical protein
MMNKSTKGKKAVMRLAPSPLLIYEEGERARKENKEL